MVEKMGAFDWKKLLCLIVVFASPLTAQETGEEIVGYEAGFFSQYQPSTALDMVRQLPGFLLDDGGSLRGFGSAAGNILINGRRPSAKQDSPSSILARIPASQVVRIELIRGQVRGIDMLGQSSLANIVLQGDFPAVVRWEIYNRFSNEGPSKPGIDASLSDSWAGIDYNAGLIVEKEANGETGYRYIYNPDRTLDEEIDYFQDSSGIDIIPTLNLSAWMGETLINANSKFVYDTRHPHARFHIIPQDPGLEDNRETIKDDLEITSFEFGADATRSLTPDLIGKVLGLYYHHNLPKVSTRRVFDPAGNEILTRVVDSETDTIEAIARLELNWLGMQDHNLQLNLETAYNSVEGALIQTDDTGTGPVVVDIPGANTKVDEVRGDFQLRDIWSFGAYELDYGLGAEVSTITQSGDENQKRSFFYVKPQGILTYRPGTGHQFRLRLEREVAQLNFNDFISSTVLEDDQLALGNPDLQPDKTWVSEVSYERRFGRISVIRVTGFYHWIDDVLDLLALTDVDAVPGNIGDGRRWGAEFESTIPVDWLGLPGSRLTFTARWQDTTVIDPVTAENRVLSAQGGNPAYRGLMSGNDNIEYFLRLNFRQDFQEDRVSWGWTVAERNERQLFKVNELDVYDEGYAIDAFVETTRWLDLKVRVLAENLLNFNETRERTVFVGRRDLSPVSFIENRSRNNGRKITVSVSGSF